MNIGAIDCGKRGGLVVLSPARAVLLSFATDVAFITSDGQYADGAMRDALRTVLDLQAYMVVERQQGHPDDGPVQAFGTGLGYGIWRGLLRGLGVRHALVHPHTWQPVMLPKGVPTKKAAIALCREKIPGLELVLAGRRVPHDGLADAGALCLYGQRTYGS